MANNSQTNNSRYRYGMCLTKGCKMCSDDPKHPIIQQFSKRDELVCPECHKPLRECHEPSKSKWWLWPAIVAGVVIILGALAYVMLDDDASADKVDDVNEGLTVGEENGQDASNTEVNTPVIDSIQTDVQPIDSQDVNISSSAQENTEVVTPAEGGGNTPTAPTSGVTGRGTLDLGYATYTGDVKNGKPHGYGTLTYKTTHKIVASANYEASPGDTFEGDFREGRISGLGYWKHNGNTVVIKP